MNENNYNTVNRSEIKVDAISLVKGKPVFTEDYVPKDSLVVKLLRSPHAHANIKSIDKSEAVSIDGIECVLTYEDVKRIPYTRAGQGFPEPSPYDTYLLDRKVRFVGDTVAVVAGKDESCVKEALKKIRVEYEILEPVLDLHKSMDSDSPRIHDEADASGIFDPDKNLASHYEMSVGNVEKTIANSDIRLECTCYYPKSQQVPLENHSTYSFLDDKERLVVISSTQVPFHARRILSKILDFPLRNIRVIKPRLGGGFGAKQGIITEGYASLVTLKTGKPAHLIFSREETFINSYTRHDMSVTVKIGADKEGMLTAIDMYALSNTGAYGDHALTVAMVCGSKTLPLYNKVDAVRFVSDIVYTNLPSAGAYRGYGAPQGLLALDSILDMLAEKTGKNPLDIKLMNTIKEGETSPIFKIMGEGREGVAQIARSCKLDECARIGREEFRWDEKFRNYGLGTQKNGKVRGVGCSLAMQGSGIAKVDMASASMKMNDDGSFNLTVGATDLGTGSDTILTQIAAEVLSVPIEFIHIYSSDTDMTPFDVGAYASSTTYVSGNAVKNTAELIKKELIKYASQIMAESEDALYVRDSMVVSEKTGESMSFEKIGTMSFYNENQHQIAATGSYVGDESPMPFMATFMEIELDLQTGVVTPIETMSVVDCGMALNPRLALGQIEGATLQAIGTALHEELRFDSKGHPINASLFRYKIPDRCSHGKITAKIVDSYEPTGPFGAKSVSEIGIDTPTVTILNALHHATGIRFNSIPLNTEKILEELEKRGIK